MGRKFKFPVNSQLFDAQEALDLHLKYLHDPKKWNPNLQHCDFHNHVWGLSHDHTENNEKIGVLKDFLRQAKVKSLQTASSAPECAPETLRDVEGKD